MKQNLSEIKLDLAQRLLKHYKNKKAQEEQEILEFEKTLILQDAHELCSFGVDDNGFVHSISPLNCEFTICGNSFDDDEGGCWVPSKKKTVTCSDCIKIIKSLRKVKIKE